MLHCGLLKLAFGVRGHMQRSEKNFLAVGSLCPPCSEAGCPADMCCYIWLLGEFQGLNSGLSLKPQKKCFYQGSHFPVRVPPLRPDFSGGKRPCRPPDSMPVSSLTVGLIGLSG